MRKRCNSKNRKDYKYYGGRGIKVCKEWDDFTIFVKDMGLRTSDKLTLDRIDPNGNYEPLNCRWVLMTEQNRNKSNSNRALPLGVTLHKKSGKFQAYLPKCLTNKPLKYIGLFNTIEAANIAVYFALRVRSL